MKKTNLLIKSATLALAVVLAGNIVAVGVDGKVVAKLTDNPLVISDIVNAAELPPSVETPQQWSTAEVYKDARYGRTWSGTASYGTQTRWEWLNDMNYVFTAEHYTTENGTVLDYQYLSPMGLTCDGAKETYISHTDDNEIIRMSFQVRIGANVEEESEHLWYYTKEQIQAVTVNVDGGDYEVPGAFYYDAVDEGDYYRVTLNKAFVAQPYGQMLKGYTSYVELKATGQIYIFEYTEAAETFDASRALTVIYSCLPVVPQN